MNIKENKSRVNYKIKINEKAKSNRIDNFIPRRSVFRIYKLQWWSAIIEANWTVWKLIRLVKYEHAAVK